MRQGHQNNKRMRGRGGRKPSNPLQRSYESNGPDVKIRGNALHVAEKYVQLARDAASAGDRVAEQSYLQHAEHYYRIVTAAQAQMPQPQPTPRGENDQADESELRSQLNEEQAIPLPDDKPATFGVAEPQPFVNGGEPNGQGQDRGESPTSGQNRDDGQSGEHRGRSRGRRSARPRPPENESEPAAAEDASAPTED